MEGNHTDGAAGPQDAKMPAPVLEITPDETVAGLYRAIALRHLAHYAQARDSAVRAGDNFADHPPAPSMIELVDQYIALVEEHSAPAIESARAAIPAIELATLIAFDLLLTNRLTDFITVGPESDAAMQMRLLVNVSAWANSVAMRELADQVRMKAVRETVVAIEKERAKGVSLDDAFDAVMARRREKGSELAAPAAG